MTKLCCTCKIDKPFSAFYFNAKQNRYLSRCKQCSREYALQWQRDNPEKSKQRSDEWRKNNRTRYRLRVAKWKREHPDRVREYGRREKTLHRRKVSARAAVATALDSGRMVRPTKCSSCLKKGRIQAHHADYAKPLEVKWLCVKCHTNAHYLRPS